MAKNHAISKFNCTEAISVMKVLKKIVPIKFTHPAAPYENCTILLQTKENCGSRCTCTKHGLTFTYACGGYAMVGCIGV